MAPRGPFPAASAPGREGRLYLAWLLARIEAAGGAVQCRRLGSLDELLLGSGERYDALVNCAGLGGGPLAGDGSVHPVRGQVLRVRAPWVKHYVNADGAYIIPNIDTVNIRWAGCLPACPPASPPRVASASNHEFPRLVACRSC